MRFKEGATQFENPETGLHIARCVRVIDLGTQQQTWQGEVKNSRMVMISFELPELIMNGMYNPEVKGKPFMVSRRFKQSLHKQASLRKTLESWRAKKFTPEELSGFDPHKLLGAPAMVNLVESESGDYVNIESITSAPKAMAAAMPKQVNPSIYFSLDEEGYDAEVLKAFGDKLRGTIMQSPEYALLHNPKQAEPQPDAPVGAEPPPGEDDPDPSPF